MEIYNEQTGQIEEVEDIDNGPSLFLQGETPSFLMSDGSVKKSTMLDVFDTSGGVIGFAENYMEKLTQNFGGEIQRKDAARAAIQKFKLLDDENANDYSIWLLVAMTLEE